MAETLFAIYLIPAILCTICGGIVTASEAEHETNLLRFAFYVQIAMVENLKSEVNDAGIVVALVIVSIFFLPCNAILLIIQGGMIAANFMWSIFKKVFKRKDHSDVL